MWKVVRVFGADLFKSVDELRECGAEVYCPVVIERRRIGGTRRKTTVRMSAAYPGWVFMRTEPAESEVSARPWLRFKFLSGAGAILSEERVQAIKADELAWNSGPVSQADEERQAFSKGSLVRVARGFLRDSIFEVVYDDGDNVEIKLVGEDCLFPTKISPFLLEPYGL